MEHMGISICFLNLFDTNYCFLTQKKKFQQKALKPKTRDLPAKVTNKQLKQFRISRLLILAPQGNQAKHATGTPFTTYCKDWRRLELYLERNRNLGTKQYTVDLWPIREAFTTLHIRTAGCVYSVFIDKTNQNNLKCYGTWNDSTPKGQEY